MLIYIIVLVLNNYYMYFQMNAMLIFVGILLGVVAYFLINLSLRIKETKRRDFIENTEHELYNKSEAELYLFSVNWCPHCKDTKIIWDKYTTSYKSSKYEITFIEVDCDKRENLAKEFKIEEYPTIVLVKNNKKYYDANTKKRH